MSQYSNREDPGEFWDGRDGRAGIRKGNAPKFSLGDQVVIKGQGNSSIEGPFIIARVLQDGTYQLSEMDEKTPAKGGAAIDGRHLEQHVD